MDFLVLKGISTVMWCHGKLFEMFLLMLLCSTCQVATEVAQDNIALPQEESKQFILPAPGIRHRPAGLLQQQQQLDVVGYPDALPTASNYGDVIQQLHSPSGVVGNLLPLEPNMAMAQIVTLDVACHTDQMIVRIVFDGSFDGLMYAKGFYSVPKCTYVTPGTGGREFEFVVTVGTCGTQYVEAPGGPPYLENIIVIQNEPGIQEVWDTARGVRCVFDGALGRGDQSQTVKAALNVDMLEQHVVTFPADNKLASASLDIQIGRGPFAPSASGMVKIGELMTMVVGVEGLASADLLVRNCVAHDGSHQDPYQLTDEKGCVLGSRKKVLGSWQKTRETGNPKIPVLAFSHFQAFKFPDKNDVYIECQVDLCSEICPVCPEDGVVRKKRSLPIPSREGSSSRWEDEEEHGEVEGREGDSIVPGNSINRSGRKNESDGEVVRLARKLRVISPEDYSLLRDSPITLVAKDTGANPGDMCMSISSFVAGLVAMFVVLVASSVFTALLCARVRSMPSASSTYPPDTSFHAFSTVSGKTR
ncbi:uncharacterized protein [Cherax quadricarinatus]|uniref:uncharacterized protein isoform X2 n=2 Tax=Cherax quadricarinatus TaxID=27406 RepID=UPI0023782155|nr:uncharacterized protein LOC128686899 isoform X2 [Cherax quadricarinatus]